MAALLLILSTLFPGNLNNFIDAAPTFEFPVRPFLPTQTLALAGQGKKPSPPSIPGIVTGASHFEKLLGF